MVPLTRDNLRDRSVETLRKGKPWQPDILLVRGSDRSVVVKDYRHRPFLYRATVGLFSVWHEDRMYRKLAGIRGIPAYYGKLDRYAILVEYIAGRNASKVSRGELKPEFFRSLRSIVDEVHARGIVLCDLRNRKNVMVTDRLEPYVIDLGTAFGRGARWNLPKNFLFDIFYQDDLLGISKLKMKLAPELLATGEAERLSKGLFLQRPAMAVRDFCVRCLKKLVSREDPSWKVRKTKK